MSELPSGTVTFLFTDIEGSTGMWEAHPDEMARSLACHDAVLRDAVESHRGQVIKTTGDGLFAAFATAQDAITAAVAGQVELRRASWQSIGPLRVRMGLHTGDAALVAGDYHGPAVNRTARLTSAGHGGQVLVSGATASLAMDRLPANAELVALGEYRLRDLGRPEVLYQLVHPELARVFPPLRTLDSYPGNLPLQVSSFIGRERELARLLAALDEARVVTLTGVGGVGKTRLALQVAAQVLPGYQFGAWLCELVAVRGSGSVVEAVAVVLDVSERSGLTLEQALVEFLRHKAMLLVLDNCEHVLDEAADLVETLERSCARVRVLATSREGLGIEGERIVAVPSLSSPGVDASPEDVAGCESVRLFVERARTFGAQLDITAENAGAIGRVCRRLDGLPLAIELAAARLPAMNPRELAARLDHRFQVLAGGRRGRVERHQTLRAAIDWSYDLLSQPERGLLERVTVFTGGWTLEAAERVCAGGVVETDRVFELTERLVARSLVVAEDRGVQTRYRLLETIRQYGEEHLAEHGETDGLRARHAHFYAEFLEAVCKELTGPDQIEAAQRLEAEQDNVLTAISHTIDTDDADLGLRLVCNAVPTVFGFHLAVQVPWLLQADSVLGLTGASQHRLYPLGLALAASREALRGDFDTVEPRCREAIAAVQLLGSTPDHVVDERLSVVRSLVALGLGAHDEAATHLQHAAEAALSGGRFGAAALQLSAAAIERMLARDANAAVLLATESLDLAHRVRPPMAIEQSLLALAGALAEQDPDRAKALLRERSSLQASIDYESFTQPTQVVLVSARLQDWSAVLELAPAAIRTLHWSGSWPQLGAIFNIVSRALASSDAEDAAVVQGAARRLAMTAIVPSALPPVTTPPGSADRPVGDSGLITQLRRDTTGLLLARMGITRLHELRAQGDAMDDDQAAAYALDAIAKAQATTTP